MSADPQTRLEEAARNFADAMNYADAHGLEPRAELDWDNGMTAMFRMTKVWKVRLTLRGIEVSP